jgi:hypothetical protein
MMVNFSKIMLFSPADIIKLWNIFKYKYTRRFEPFQCYTLLERLFS